MDGILKDGSSISGSLSGQSPLSGVLSDSSSLSGNLTISGGIATDIYKGEYEIVPSTKLDQLLNTKNKTLTDDLLVKKITYIETSNIANGKTIYIGEDD